MTVTPAGDNKHRREARGHPDQVGGEVAGVHRRVPPSVRAGRAAVQHLERVEGPADAGAQPAAQPARLARAQRKRRPLTRAQVSPSNSTIIQ